MHAEVGEYEVDQLICWLISHYGPDRGRELFPDYFRKYRMFSNLPELKYSLKAPAYRFRQIILRVLNENNVKIPKQAKWETDTYEYDWEAMHKQYEGKQVVFVLMEDRRKMVTVNELCQQVCKKLCASSSVKAASSLAGSGILDIEEPQEDSESNCSEASEEESGLTVEHSEALESKDNTITNPVTVGSRKMEEEVRAVVRKNQSAKLNTKQPNLFSFGVVKKGETKVPLDIEKENNAAYSMNLSTSYRQRLKQQSEPAGNDKDVVDLTMLWTKGNEDQNKVIKRAKQ